MKWSSACPSNYSSHYSYHIHSFVENLDRARDRSFLICLNRITERVSVYANRFTRSKQIPISPTNIIFEYKQNLHCWDYEFAMNYYCRVAVVFLVWILFVLSVCVRVCSRLMIILPFVYGQGDNVEPNIIVERWFVKCLCSYAMWKIEKEEKGREHDLQCRHITSKRNDWINDRLNEWNISINRAIHSNWSAWAKGEEQKKANARILPIRIIDSMYWNWKSNENMLFQFISGWKIENISLFHREFGSGICLSRLKRVKIKIFTTKKINYLAIFKPGHQYKKKTHTI